MAYYREIAPKPYELVPFAEKTPRSPCQGHHKYNQDLFTGVLELSLHTERPVQVASGYQDFTKDNSGRENLASVMPVVEKGGKQWHVIPGSSLKGALRSIVEAISPSCLPFSSKKLRQLIPDQVRKCASKKHLCPACRLFGVTGGGKNSYQGNLFFEDIFVDPRDIELWRTPILWTPGGRSKLIPRRYLSNNKLAGRKFYYHGKSATGPDSRVVVKQGVNLGTKISFENLSEAFLGLVVAALGLAPQYPFLIKVGAGKPVGMGSIRVDLKGISLMGSIEGTGRMVGSLKKLENIVEQLSKWVNAACGEGLIIPDNLKKLAEILGEKTLNRQSPKGLY